MNAKPWTHSKCCRCGRSALHLSFLFWKMFHKKMKEILFEVSTVFRSSMFCTSWRKCHSVFEFKTVRYARSPNCCAFKSVLWRPYPWLEMHCRRTQSHRCRPARSTAHSNSTLSNRALMAFTFQGHSKGTRAWQNIIQSLWSKILFIKFRKMLGRYHSTNPEE